MLKQIYFFLCLLVVSNISAQTSMTTPSKYESDKFDYVYKWDTIQKPTEQEVIVLKEYQNSLLSNLYRLRIQNKTRWYLECLPDEIQQLRYVQSHKLSDGTVPIFKFILELNDNKGDRDKRITENKTTLKTILDSGVKKSTTIPAEYKNYIEDISINSPITASQYYEDPYVKIDTLAFCSSNWIEYFLQSGYDCYNEEELSNLKTISEREGYDMEKYIDILNLFKNRIVTFRFFVNRNGEVKYIDCIEDSDISYTCFKHVTNQWATMIINNYDFKPSIKNNTPIDAYIKISVFLSGDCDENTPKKTKRK